MFAYSKDDYLHMAYKRRMAFMDIARKLGKEHAITKMMGDLSHGRYSAEPGVNPGLRDAIEAKAFLDGVFNVLNLWARDNDSRAQQVMLALYPTNYEKAR